MKKTIITIQLLVGILFIISGLVKANDPLGLAYKMEEFFQLWSGSLAKGSFFAKTPTISFLHFLNGHTLFLSVFMITMEMGAGVALLVGWKKQWILYLLLALILFFSFLTGYAYLSGKITNCGCLGDCLPVTPLTSFLKDLILLAAIIFLLIGYRHIFILSSGELRGSIVAVSLGFSLLLQSFVLNYLPLADCLPLKKGNNIAEQIKPPRNAIPSVYETRLVYQNRLNGQVKEMSNAEFNSSKIWQDSNWKWKETKTKLIKQGTDIPKLPNFSLTTVWGEDRTESILSDSNYVLLYWLNASEDPGAIDEEIIKTAIREGVATYFVTTTSESIIDKSPRVLVCDGTVFRIAARVNPTIYLLKKGTIINKWPLNNKYSILSVIKNLDYHTQFATHHP